jgi:uncharacterized membrane protein
MTNTQPALKSSTLAKQAVAAKAAIKAPMPAKAKPAPTKPTPAPVSAAAKRKAPATPAPTSAKAKPATTTKPAQPPEPAKAPKEKLVRDGFTFPANEYARIGELKRRAMTLGVDTKKSEIVRAGLVKIAALADAEFLAALAGIPKMKTGRKRKEKAA